MTALKPLHGRLLEIATGNAGLPLSAVFSYREKFRAAGYEVPDFGTCLAQKPKPGTALKHILSLMGITEKGCRCKTVAALMDRKGVEWCQENLNRLARRMERAARRRKWLRHAPFKRWSARKLITAAIRQSVREASRDNDKIIVTRAKLPRIGNDGWAVGITTAPRNPSTLARCVRSLQDAGWPHALVLAEPGSDLEGIEGCTIVQNATQEGPWYNWGCCWSKTRTPTRF